MAKPRAVRHLPAAATGQENEERGADISELAGAVWALACSLAAIAMRVGPLRRSPDNVKMLSLDAMGFNRYEIAGILGTTPETVSTRLSEARAGRPRR